MGGGCPVGAKTLLCDPMAAMPKSIKDTGVYPAIPDLTKHAERLLAYTPEPALWSDGLGKERFLLLPAGAKIDNTDAKKWKFPAGTVFVKSFFGDGQKIVETRFIRFTADDFFPFEYYVYKWNAAGTDAVMQGWQDGPGFDPRQNAWEAELVPATVNGKAQMHPIPSQINCGDCHDANKGNTGGVAFIGFDEIRLDNTPAGSGKTQLQTFADLGIFKVAPGAAAVTDANALTQRVKRFLFGNCVHCHSGAPDAKSTLDLHPDTLLAQTVNKDVNALGITEPPKWKRVVPGSPETSVLFAQLAREQPFGAPAMTISLKPGGGTYGLRAMPPVGVTVSPTGAVLKPGESDPVLDVYNWIKMGAK
jgi:hypothetical protein